MNRSSFAPHASDTERAVPANAPTAVSLMMPNVRVIRPDMGLDEITSFLLEHRQCIAPVVRADGNRKILLGLVTEQTCLEYLVNEIFYGDPCPRTEAQTIMQKHPICVSRDVDLFTLASMFLHHPFRHLIIAEGEEFIGIVNRHDVIAALEQYYRQWLGTRDRDRFPVNVHEIMNHRFLVTR
ncbi:CBS domain-containing protein [Crateriforma conspicua]|uniref:CBS domain protein n=1 Tax=Crateriforma conspicua TaxID=2527996 RepID=A0A5C5Y3Z2_9PLAN|nr:CBS domain-containing protein [Crateriforma conspicua]QDV64968.1 CBS domain protein [Crateriforma conspicua]TWT70367.1 CBS domain protein [Crateriforma conspicua]